MGIFKNDLKSRLIHWDARVIQRPSIYLGFGVLLTVLLLPVLPMETAVLALTVVVIGVSLSGYYPEAIVYNLVKIDLPKLASDIWHVFVINPMRYARLPKSSKEEQTVLFEKSVTDAVTYRDDTRKTKDDTY